MQDPTLAQTAESQRRKHSDIYDDKPGLSFVIPSEGPMVSILGDGMARICKVLVVEDNAEIRELLGNLFGYEGYRFDCVATASAFREELAKGDVDVAIVDYVIPGPEDGLALANEAADRGCGVILVTGHHDHFASVENGGHRYLYKPFAIKSLIDLVEETLRETRRKCEVKGRRYG